MNRSRLSILVLSLALIGNAPPPAPVEHGAPAEHAAPAAPPPRPSPSQRIAPFAAQLAESPLPALDGRWPSQSDAAAWTAIARSTPQTRQPARWALAQALIARDRMAEAAGVLDTMLADDPALALTAPWQLAHGVVLAGMERPAEALHALDTPLLVAHPEACAWRVRAGLATQQIALAAGAMRCAVPALSGRSVAARRPFLLAFADVALASGHPGDVARMLAALGDPDSAANLRRARAAMALGDRAGGRLLLQRVMLSGTPPLRTEATLALIEDRFATRELTPAAAAHDLDALSFWRGGPIERGALTLRWRIAEARHDSRAALAAGATLFRYFDLGDQTAPTLLRLQTLLGGLVDSPDAGKIGVAAGVFWDYRDLLPGGGEGETIAARLADRLAGAGLYARAADLLRFLLDRRAPDAATGPLSIRVAELDLLAGAPERSLRTLRAGQAIVFPADITARRRTIEAAALYRLGKADEALALLDGAPGSAELRGDILWQKRDWGGFAASNAATLPARAASEADQTRVLRQAVALSRTGNRSALTALRTRYAAGFARLPTHDAFDYLTAPAATLDPAKADKAFARLATLDAPLPLTELMR
ncbi:endoglucanase [Sphingomonas sp. PvP056]|uniref:endoglucanase n=1 Tax=Sphingomonas sp. PvP056 TaxID=3156392 RepID=UPI00339AF79B